MGLKRIYRHMMTAERHVRKIFQQTQLNRISNAIKASETRHSGEIRVAVESSLELQQLLGQQTPRQRAIEVFSELHVWDTELNNGVLIYVLLADHAKAFAQGQFEEGVMSCIEAVSEKLIEHFPHRREDENELPDAPVLIG
ncbi:MAG: TPM domain-containing protein [Burkholderiales bacterium]|uniref:TPM domain-containing protein n=1 Tax=Limnobacter sp. TaxID=2003368 RepID=UPI0039BD6D02|nr:TPM domain-containing protein [Burkholderiales bacterium]